MVSEWGDSNCSYIYFCVISIMFYNVYTCFSVILFCAIFSEVFTYPCLYLCAAHKHNYNFPRGLNKIYLFLLETTIICQDVGGRGENPSVAAGEPVCLRPWLHRGGREGGGEGTCCPESILTSSSHWSQTSRVRR